MNSNAFFPLRLQLPDGKEYQCTRQTVSVGRSAECDIVFSSSRTISRRHAEIYFREGVWYIRDTNSVNGTEVNGRKLPPMEECALDVGDRIRLAPDVTLEVLPTPTAPGRDWRNDTVGFEPVVPAVGASIAQCTVCGHYFDLSRSKFCPNCGFQHGTVRQPRDSTVTMEKPRQNTGEFCPKCGNRASGLFCNMCGSRLDGRGNSTAFWDGEDSTALLNEQSRAPEYPRSMPAPAPSMAPPPPAPSMAPPPAPSRSSRPAPAPAPSMAPSPAPAAAKAPAKKPGLFGKLFGGKKAAEPAPSRTVPPAVPYQVPAQAAPPQPVSPQTDDIQFRGAAPRNINPGEYFTVKIMMYREDDYQRADRETAAVAEEVKAASSSVFQASRGQEFRIVLQSPDVELDTESETLRWNGIFAAADFEVLLPDTYDRKQLRLRGRVYSGDAVLTDLKLILQVSAPAPQDVVCEKVRMQTAFISYASADRAKVVARLQGIMLARPDMDLFFDVESLRRGEAWEPRLYKEISQRDLFYLFWSHNAAASEWVQKELEYAVEQKTVEFIEPIPLEGPDICPPPASLMCKHFNDWTLRYLNN